MNNFTKKQAKEILPLLKKAVQLQSDVWNIQGDLEEVCGARRSRQVSCRQRPANSVRMI